MGVGLAMCFWKCSTCVQVVICGEVELLRDYIEFDIPIEESSHVIHVNVICSEDFSQIYMALCVKYIL